MQDDKYIVFKREDFDDFLIAMKGKLTPGVGAAMDDLLVSTIKDAVVIRKQDAFAGPALEVYSASARLALQFMLYGDPRREHVVKIADYFQHASEDAYDTLSKVPD